MEEKKNVYVRSAKMTHKTKDIYMIKILDNLLKVIQIGLVIFIIYKCTKPIYYIFTGDYVPGNGYYYKTK